MKKEIIILGSTGSIGTTTLNLLSKEKNFKVKLLTTNTNAKKLLIQSKKHKVRDVIIYDKKTFSQYQKIFKKKKIRIYPGNYSFKKILKKKVNFCVNSISGIDGFEPTLKSIPFTKNILIANKETIICGWSIIIKYLQKYKTNFIPIDSEHFSISKLLNGEKLQNIEKVVLTASGGPFLNKPFKSLTNIEPSLALKHPKWKMGKKISIDSSTMMNKIFEFIEAKKLFNLKNKDLEILIHPKSFVHAIIFFKNKLIKILAHDTSMDIPILNALNIENKFKKKLLKKNLKSLNQLNFQKPSLQNFPLLSLLNIIPEKDSYFETILITINDTLVNMYLEKKINYKSLQLNLINLIKKPYLTKFYKLKPLNIYDIKLMINITKFYIKKNIKHYD